jgi:putative ABC transport system ATP-binding protein
VTNNIITVENLRKTFGEGAGEFTALNYISLTIPAGRSIALLGQSGSGKSTLLNILGAVDRPTSGRVIIDGLDLSTQSEAQLALFRRRRLGYVFQSFHLVPSLTVFDNVAVPFTLDRSLTSQRHKEIHDLLARLGVDEKARRYPDELSGGQQQRVALARAVIHHPDVLLADEPTGNLDAQNGKAILDLLAELQRDFNVTIVMATHSQEAARRCDQRIILSDGKIISIEEAA